MKTYKTFTALCLSALLLQDTVCLHGRDQSDAAGCLCSARHSAYQPAEHALATPGYRTAAGNDVNGRAQSAKRCRYHRPVAAYSLPATLGELTITLSSEVQQNQVFAPNVLILDENLRPPPGSQPLFFLSATRRDGR